MPTSLVSVMPENTLAPIEVNAAFARDSLVPAHGHTNHLSEIVIDPSYYITVTSQ